MAVRDHTGTTLSSFNGLYQRGDPDTVPIDHFQNCQNIDFLADSTFLTRPGVGIDQDVLVPLSNVKRIYNYPTQTSNTLIVLSYDNTRGLGSIYHVLDETTVYGPILTIAGMTDFAFVPFAGRAYISPFSDYTDGILTFQKGLQNQYLYVYAGDGTPARQAAGVGFSGTMTVANGVGGYTDIGTRVFGFVSETVSGYYSPPTVLTEFSTSGTSVSFGNIPTSGDPNVIARLLVSTIAIPTYNGDLSGYQFFFVPGAVINDNTSTFLNDVSFYDADLLQDASYLLNNYTAIPAGASLTLYHNRLCLAATYTDISLILVSAAGQPEAIDQVSGLCIVPLDGNPITNMQEYNDILYVTKRSRTVSFTDNQGNPSSWPLIVVDNALGSGVHGIATVLDSGSSSVAFLIIATYQGISLFNGTYTTPELTWKISAFWKQYANSNFGRIQMVNEPIGKKLYTVLPDRTMLVGDYQNGLGYKTIRWCPWTFLMGVNTVAINNVNDVILGADLANQV